MKNLILVVLGIIAFTINADAQIIKNILGEYVFEMSPCLVGKAESFENQGYGTSLYFNTILKEDPSKNLVLITIWEEGEYRPSYVKKFTLKELEDLAQKEKGRGFISWNFGNKFWIIFPLSGDVLLIGGNLSEENNEPAGTFEVTYHLENLSLCFGSVLVETNRSKLYKDSDFDGLVSKVEPLILEP